MTTNIPDSVHFGYMIDVKREVSNAYEDIGAALKIILEYGSAEELYDFMDSSKSSIEKAMEVLEPHLPDDV